MGKPVQGLIVMTILKDSGMRVKKGWKNL